MGCDGFSLSAWRNFLTRTVTGKSVGFWVAKRMGGSFCPDEAVAIGLERHGKLIAGTIFEQWNGRSMVCHMAIDGLMTPEYLRGIAEYAFKTCGAYKIIAPVYSDNWKAMRLIPHLGFTEEAAIESACPGGDDIVFFTMTVWDCPFLKGKY